MSLIRLGILADNRLFSEGLHRILAADPSILIVAEADNPTSFKPIPDPSFDILLADSRVDRALALCSDLGRLGARPWVILLGADPDDAWAVTALETGARGILAKNADGDNLIKAVRVVHEGQIWASKRVFAKIAEILAARAADGRRLDTRLRHHLSPREHEIVRHVASGLSNQEIADRLAISQSTVKAHLTSCFQKLTVRDRAQLAALYHRAPPLGDAA